jgi:DNA-binding transcriptional MerR regulator
MKLTSNKINDINMSLEKIKKFISLNSGADLDNIKDELYEIIQHIEEETHRCYNDQDE